MRLHPTMTFEQYKATYLALMAEKTKVKQNQSWKGYVSIALACLAIGLAPQLPAARTPVFSIFAVFILYSVACKPLARRAQEKCLKAIYDEEQAKLNDQVLTIDESGVSCDQSKGLATSHQTWPAFIKRIDTPDAFVFLPSPNTFLRIPKEHLTLADQQLILEWSSRPQGLGNSTQLPKSQ